MQSQRYITVADAAVRYGVSQNTMRSWIKTGVVASIRIGGRRLISLKALEALEQEQEPGGASSAG